MSDRPMQTEEEYVRPRRVRRKKTPWQKFKEAYLPLIVLALAVILVVSMIVGIAKLIAGSGSKTNTEPTDTTPVVTTDPNSTPAEVQAALNQAEELIKQYDYDGAIAGLNALVTDDMRVAQAINDYTKEKSTLLAWADNTEVPMLSFQPIIVDASRAFDGDSNAAYYGRNNLTAEEFRKILNQLHANGYVLVNMTDLASQKADGSFTENVIYLPDGKKPIMISLVPAHYTAVQASDGFARRLSLDADGNVISEYITSNAEKQTGVFDFVTILEEYLAANPDFSYRGSRAILGLNGDSGPLGYKLTEGDDASEEADKFKTLADKLKDLGYQFACFSYEGIRYGSAEDSAVKSDVDMWVSTYRPVLGDTAILIYSGGSDLDEYEGAKYDTLYGAGFRYFCTMDNNITSWVSITDSYLRTARRTINGTRITEDAKLLEDLFDAKSVVDSARH